MGAAESLQLQSVSSEGRWLELPQQVRTQDNKDEVGTKELRRGARAARAWFFLNGGSDFAFSGDD